MTRWFRIPLTAAIVVAVVLLVAMAAGGANSTVFERYFPILLIVTSFATIALLAFIGAVVYRLFKQRRNKVFGSRMTINLALYLSLAAVFPCLLLYFVSSQFIGRSIDSWFDVRVEQALDSGVALSSEVLTREQHQLLQTARRIASILNASVCATKVGADGFIGTFTVHVQDRRFDHLKVVRRTASNRHS